MTDPYYARIVELFRPHVDPEAAAASPPQTSELEDRLTRPRPEEATYTPPTVQVRDVVIPTPSYAIPARVYQPIDEGSGRPLLVWCHGGGFVGGDLDMPEADAVAREMAARADAVVVSVDYRLCLDGVHYPAPSDDVIAVVDWATSHAETLGAAATRLIVGGASAGACLAASATLRIRDRGGLQPAASILAYPIVHPVVPEHSAELTSKVADLSPGMAFAPEIMIPIMENYLGRDVADALEQATPGLAVDLSGLAPTLIFNCEYDGLRSSGERYAEQLREAGVVVDEHFVAGVSHGHLNRPGLPEAQHSLDQMTEWLRAHHTADPALS